MLPTLKYFHLTRLQWRGILKWTLYSLLGLATLLLQTVVLAQLPVFGAKLAPLPLYIVCVCVREGPEKGGLFALLATLFWCLSGADYGNISVALLPIGSIFAAILCRVVLTQGLLPTALCAFAVSLLNASVIFAFKLILPPTLVVESYWRVLLPGVALSTAFVPIQYPLVRRISRIGVPHEL